MYMTSTLSPQSNSEGSVPVAIFALGDRRKFLRVSEDYQNTLRQVIQSFDLDDDVLLSLRTSTIDVCQGEEVEIDESAYRFLWTFLGKIDVSIVEGAQVGRRQQKKAQGKGRALTPIDTEFPPSPSNHGLEMEDFPMASSTVIHPNPPLDEGLSHTPIPEEFGREIDGLSNAATAGGRVHYSQKSRKHVDDEQSDDQLEGDRVSEETAVPLKKIPYVRQITELEDNGEGGSNLQKKFKPRGAFFPKSLDQIVSSTLVKKDKPAEPGNEVLISTPPKQVKSAIPATPAPPPPPPPEEDPRFEITIIGPQNESAQFKTRGKHPVRKVLAAACKTFGIKYEQARLILSVSTEEGGEIQTDEFDCPAEETMSQCGVDGRAKLFVRVDADQDDEEHEAV
ncbi:hypothetical protein BYT27DRAFT_6482472 [Phlegmacium glaucopus]|nr:hypothetical protein BYT27DRAFT_6482472 [Phlegmacium glaucopus]